MRKNWKRVITIAICLCALICSCSTAFAEDESILTGAFSVSISDAIAHGRVSATVDNEVITFVSENEIVTMTTVP